MFGADEILLSSRSQIKGIGSVVQLVRMPPCHGGGRGFESRPVRKISSDKSELISFMAYFVYIIESLQDGSFYKGYSENPYERLIQHNDGESEFTSHKTPWKLVYLEECSTKKEALIREKNLKKADRARIKALIYSSKNLFKSNG